MQSTMTRWRETTASKKSLMRQRATAGTGRVLVISCPAQRRNSSKEVARQLQHGSRLSENYVFRPSTRTRTTGVDVSLRFRKKNLVIDRDRVKMTAPGC